MVDDENQQGGSGPDLLPAPNPAGTESDPARPDPLGLREAAGLLRDAAAVLARYWLPLLAIAIIFMPFFSKLKSMIPLFNSYSWDHAFIAWDRAIFFGYDAWQVLQPVFGYPVITALMAALYHVWMLLIYMGTLFFIFYPAADRVRRHYMLGFVLIWTLVGGAMAREFTPEIIGPAGTGMVFVFKLEND